MEGSDRLKAADGKLNGCLEVTLRRFAMEKSVNLIQYVIINQLIVLAAISHRRNEEQHD